MKLHFYRRLFIKIIKRRIKASQNWENNQGNSPIKEFEPFKVQSTFNKYIESNSNHKHTFDPVKFRALASGSATEDYTSPSLPTWLSRGVVPSPLDYESIPDQYKTKSTMMFEHKPQPLKGICKF